MGQSIAVGDASGLLKGTGSSDHPVFSLSDSHCAPLPLSGMNVLIIFSLLAFTLEQQSCSHATDTPPARDSSAYLP